jgi:hypothetical protein
MGQNCYLACIFPNFFNKNMLQTYVEFGERDDSRWTIFYDITLEYITLSAHKYFHEDIYFLKKNQNGGA